MNPSTFKPGDKVHYTSGTGEKEDGIVKSNHPDKPWVWVVYNCAGHWERYQDYTAACTDLADLQIGWVHGGRKPA